MRQILIVLAIVLLLVVPAFAQDATIAEIVVASAESETPEFTTLLAALGLADPELLEALADPELDVTVFAPTDAAFAALAEALGDEDFNAVLEDTVLLTDILLYHIIAGSVYSEDVVDGLLEFEGELPVVTFNGQFFFIAGTLTEEDELDLEAGITIDDANLVLEMVDIEASNGIIHVIDAVLLPETRTIAEIVNDASEEEEPEFTTLLGAVGLADPSVLELLLDSDSELTVFAPTDAAFAALEEALGEEAFLGVLEDPELLTSILTYHVVPGIVYSFEIPDFLDDMGMFTLEMADGSVAVISVSEEGVFINDAPIILLDIQATNGVIHVIDAVILPSTEE